MIIKTFDLNSTIQQINSCNSCLFYGENLGLIEDLKKEIIKSNKDLKIIRKNQDVILKNTEYFFDEYLNMSLFEESKIFFIDQADDKIIDLLKEVEKKINNNKVYLFSGILNKNSKLRTYFEKSKKLSVVPCYLDDEKTIIRIIRERLSNFNNLNREIINTILESCNKNRIKLNNELNKIETCFNKKTIELPKLIKLLNTNENEDLYELTNSALEGNKFKINKLLSETIIQNENSIFILNLINHRMKRLLDIINLSVKNNFEQAINTIKPPIFWKEKKNFSEQLKKLNKNKINLILKKTFYLEFIIKSNSSYNSQILVKKLLVDVCDLATA